MPISLPCLFCGDTSRKRTTEHIVQRGFGSNWTLPNDVCCKCNTEIFSPMDKALIEFARLFVYWEHPDVTQKKTFLQLGHSIYLDQSSGLWISVRVDKDATPVLLPQLIVGKTGIQLIVDAKNTNSDYELRIIKAELAVPDKLHIEKLILPNDSNDGNLPEIEPALIRSSPKKYLIRAADEVQCNQVNKDIIDGNFLWKNDSQGNTTNQKGVSCPEIQSSLTVDISSIDRALSKSAVNIVCSCLGSQRARSDSLKNIKEFILGNSPYTEGEFVEHLWLPNSVNGLSSSSQWLSNQYFSKAGCHTTLLTSMPDNLAKVVFILTVR